VVHAASSIVRPSDCQRLAGNPRKTEVEVSTPVIRQNCHSERSEESFGPTPVEVWIFRLHFSWQGEASLTSRLTCLRLQRRFAGDASPYRMQSGRRCPGALRAQPHGGLVFSLIKCRSLCQY
jgi:hypothetical protein